MPDKPTPLTEEDLADLSLLAANSALGRVEQVYKICEWYSRYCEESNGNG